VNGLAIGGHGALAEQLRSFQSHVAS